MQDFDGVMINNLNLERPCAGCFSRFLLCSSNSQKVAPSTGVAGTSSTLDSVKIVSSTVAKTTTHLHRDARTLLPGSISSKVIPSKWENTSVLLCFWRAKIKPWRVGRRRCGALHHVLKSRISTLLFLKLPSRVVSSSLVWQTDLGLTERAGKYVTDILVMWLKGCGNCGLIRVVCRGLGEDGFFMWH